MVKGAGFQCGDPGSNPALATSWSWSGYKCLFQLLFAVYFVNSKLVCLRPVGILIMLCLYSNYLFLGI